MNEYTFRCCELDSLAAKQAAMHVRSCFFLLARVARRRTIGGGTSHAPHSETKEFFVIFRAASAVVLEEVVGEAKEEEEGEGEEEEGTTAGIRLRGRGRRLARCGRGSIGPLFPSMSKQLKFIFLQCFVTRRKEFENFFQLFQPHVIFYLLRDVIAAHLEQRQLLPNLLKIFGAPLSVFVQLG